jgi:hypothetical protein
VKPTNSNRLAFSDQIFEDAGVTIGLEGGFKTKFGKSGELST